MGRRSDSIGRTVLQTVAEKPTISFLFYRSPVELGTPAFITDFCLSDAWRQASQDIADVRLKQVHAHYITRCPLILAACPVVPSIWETTEGPGLPSNT